MNEDGANKAAVCVYQCLPRRLCVARIPVSLQVPCLCLPSLQLNKPIALLCYFGSDKMVSFVTKHYRYDRFFNRIANIKVLQLG
jgi:hypothetical protein